MPNGATTIDGTFTPTGNVWLGTAPRLFRLVDGGARVTGNMKITGCFSLYAYSGGICGALNCG